MTTAVDSSVLLDILNADPDFGMSSREALRAACSAGPVVACEVVWAEVRAHVDDDESFDRALGTLGVRFDAIGDSAAAAAGRLWRRRTRERDSRRRMVADVLIGAHAASHANVLLTRDRGFYRRYFQLRVMDPSP